ncbi:amino acid adenylation domain-containing protein [Streptomyces sp. MUM 178J]|uniref:amino acid adenylation domain-containing protein n=1 Tax=Streptomyces sp. MUM 178J TaxID=2791991 RepID=UPI001F04C329|nr:amino acid adenylation domain-containing protein [Streptomyces sp. MUM 178J]WRQ78036.1 amino acid adenylation domain-containing protein [Streptomyces sp. MUM 178J]
MWPERGLPPGPGHGPAVALPYDCIHHAFEAQAAVRPDAVAAEHGDMSITYGELDRQADRLAGLLSAAGIGGGDLVPVVARRGIPLLVGLLAALKAGAAYVPLDARITPAEQLRHVLGTTRARVVLTTSDHRRLTPLRAVPSVIEVDTAAASPLPAPDARRPAGAAPTGDDACYVLFTSGTTGPPNGVVVTHRNVCNLLLTEPGGLGIGPGQRVSQILNIAFDMAAWEILGALGRGATLLIRGRDIAETVRRADVVIATPTILTTVDPAHCERVRVVAVAGEPCPRALADRWAARAVFYNSCGPTETTIVNTMQRHIPSAPRLTIGRPTPNNTVYVLDAARRPLPPGETGEIWAGGAGISAGYLDNPELTAQRYAPDPFLGGGRLMFRTRDLGRWTADGELEILGRTDDQVKIRGFRVELDAVSAVLEALPGCVRAATLKLDSRTLVSFIARESSEDGPDPQTARQAVAAALPYYCVPDAVHILPRLPRTSRGKIDKAALRGLAEQRRAVHPEPADPAAEHIRAAEAEEAVR